MAASGERKLALLRRTMQCRAGLSRIMAVHPESPGREYTRPMTKERTIKKYANRRLYDATVSRHVTLEDIRNLIVQGEKIRVIEDKSSEDITRLILLQVIAEQEQFGRPLLSTALLESIIRFYGDAMQELMAKFLETSVESFLCQKDALREQIARLMSEAPAPAAASMAEIARRNSELWECVQQSLFAALRQGAEPVEAGPRRGNGAERSK
jgi:polyhydroxyalkanoate synthesis repressor PhaR